MAHHDPRIDACIANAAPFAQPLLAEIRRRVHAGCSEVEETIKWGMPSFLYRGKLVCGMAAFKQHASLGFWGHGDAAGNEGMGQYGKLTGPEQLPDAASFQAALQAAMARIDAGVKRPAGKPRAALPMPDDLRQALAADARAQAGFQALAPSYRRDYIQWISEAKREATRRQRITQAVQWLAEGKKRNWKYDNG